MINLAKTLSILSFLILIYGCKEKNGNCIYYEFLKSSNGERTIRKQIDKCNGNKTTEEQEFAKDNSGNLIANGYRRIIYPNGRTKGLSFYKNGIQDSLSLSYYENGLLSKKNYLIGDSLGHFFGPQYYYSMDNFVDSLEDYTQYGEKFMTLRFDKDKSLKSISGTLMYITIGGKIPYFDSIPIKSSLLMMNQVAKVNGMKTILNMKLKHDNIIVFDTIITKYFAFYNSSMTGIKHKFSKKGDYIFTAKVTLVDSSSGKEIHTDTLSRKIVVY